MTMRVLAPILCLVLVAAAWAETPNRGGQRQEAQAAPIAISWFPKWLKEPIDRAIADAHDPHERKKAR